MWKENPVREKKCLQESDFTNAFQYYFASKLKQMNLQKWHLYFRHYGTRPRFIYIVCTHVWITSVWIITLQDNS